ncbi:MAG: TolC family protein [Pseudomonadota bacterium]
MRRCLGLRALLPTSASRLAKGIVDPRLKAAHLVFGLFLSFSLVSPGWAGAREAVTPAERNAADGQQLEGACPAPTGPLTLAEAYRRALQTHEQVQIARTEVEKARLQPLKAWTLLLPRIDLLGSYTHYGTTETAGTPGTPGASEKIFPADLYQANLQVVQPLFDRTFLSRREAAGSTIKVSRYTLTQTGREILFRVASACYNLLKAQSLITVASETLDLAREEVRVADARFRVGEETKTAVLRAEVDVARAERNLTQARNNQKLQAAILGNLIATGPVSSVDAPEPRPTVQEPLDVYQKLAGDNREDLKAQCENLKLTQYNRDMVQEELYPVANATLNYARVTPQTLIALDNLWTLMFSVDVPIFEGGLTYVNLREADKNIQQARLRVGDLRKQIMIEVEDAYLQVQTLAGTLATLQKQAELAAENYNIVFKQFQVGVATSLDVTDALTSLSSARVDLANERYNYQVALLNLDRVTGVFGQDYLSDLAPEPAKGWLGLF